MDWTSPVNTPQEILLVLSPAILFLLILTVVFVRWLHNYDKD